MIRTLPENDWARAGRFAIMLYQPFTRLTPETAVLPSRLLASVILFGLLFAIADRTSAQPPQQKKVLTHADYDAWRSATGVTLSPDGKYLAYTVSPLDGGDAEVIVRHIPSGKDTKIARGGRPADGPAPAPGAAPTLAVGSPQFSPNSSKVVFPLSPTKAELDKA